MKRTIVTLLVGFLFLVPAISRAGSPSPKVDLAEKVAALEALVATLQRQLNAEIAARQAVDQQLLADIENIPNNDLADLAPFITPDPATNQYKTRIIFHGVTIQ